MATSNSLADKVIPVPTLSTLGFVYDSANKFDSLVAHAFVADYNQTYLYPGAVTSIPRMIEKIGNDKIALINEIQSRFYEYLSRYYEAVTVVCTLGATESGEEDGTLNIQLVITVTELNSQSVYGRLINTVNSRLKKIIKLNNIG